MSNIIDAYCVYQCAKEIKRSTEVTREMIDQKAYIYRKRYHVMKTPKIIFPVNNFEVFSQNLNFNDRDIGFTTLIILLPFPFFRHNGVSIQSLTYQIYCEGLMFLVVLFIAIIPLENNIFTSRILGILWTFVVFVIQPLFYFNGDVNFRNRVLQQGLCKALKRELFQTKEEFQKVKWFCQAIWIFKEFCTKGRQNIYVKVYKNNEIQPHSSNKLLLHPY